ncbi:hypothetical protein NQ317_018246 [Molorchus minor]|uniref:phospholipase A2 n=1 Tax=Molorchus minor TaxID=1323400 RepID=A0ABQ9K5D3_9CUCU|nr:hypothetical protein NQ317_018246 [Molorchus minor]
MTVLKMQVSTVIVLLHTIVIYQVLCSTVYIADYGMSKMVELSTKPPYCVVQLDRGIIRDMLITSDPRRVRQMSDESIDKLEKVCRENKLNSAHQGGFIYPGTKWCGPGSIARNYSDLGYHVKEDTCCREHDRCPKFLGHGECRKGICNNSPFTRSHCDCDATFRRCLQNVNTETANTIGAIFFNVVQVICFKERTPCTPWQSLESNSLEPFQNQNESCGYRYEKSGRYIASIVTRLNFTEKHAFLLNIFLRKFKLL